MTRTVKHVGPALATVVLAIIATGGLAVATSNGATPAGVSAVAASTTMLNDGVYGTGIGYDTKANLWVGGDNQKVAIKFKATSSSALNSMRFVQRGGSGYSMGNGGTMAISVQADDGAGHPSGTALAQQSYSPANPAGAWEKYDAVTFSSPATLTAGTTYYIVFTNPSTANYISVNSVFIYGGSSPRQPMYSDSEFGLMYTNGAWGSVHSGYTPVVDLAYASGVHAGQAYYEAMIANYATISGASSMARERFSVTGGDKTVKSASVRVRRSSGSSPLTLTLETSAGVAIESATVPAADVPVSAPGGDNGGSKWVTANFSTPRVLTNGSTYNLRVSTASGTTYTTFPVRSGEDKGFQAYTFSGSGQFTNNGSSWTDSYLYAHQDLQFYFAVAAATPTTTTTTPPVTTTTTTPPVTTTTAPPTTTTNPAVAPDWMASQVPAGTAGVDYSFQYDATGTPKPTYALTTGLLPPGLTLTPAGLLAGKPTTAGSFTFTVSAQNGVAPDAVRERTIVISPAPAPTTTTTPPAAAATSLQCPLVVAPTVGQTVTCTYK